MRNELGVLVEQSLYQQQVCQSLPAALRIEFQLQGVEPQPCLHLQGKLHGRSFH